MRGAVCQHAAGYSKRDAWLSSCLLLQRRRRGLPLPPGGQGGQLPSACRGSRQGHEARLYQGGSKSDAMQCVLMAAAIVWCVPRSTMALCMHRSKSLHRFKLRRTESRTAWRSVRYWTASSLAVMAAASVMGADIRSLTRREPTGVRVWSISLSSEPRPRRCERQWVWVEMSTSRRAQRWTWWSN